MAKHQILVAKLDELRAQNGRFYMCPSHRVIEFISDGFISNITQTTKYGTIIFNGITSNFICENDEDYNDYITVVSGKIEPKKGYGISDIFACKFSIPKK